MSLRNLPEIRADAGLAGMQFDVREDAIDAWQPELQAAAPDPATSISIYGRIGQGIDGQGVTSRSIAAALRSIGPRAVTVNINSPGGDYFEGLGIYNLLRQHAGEVTVNVLSMAASAASVIAMAGDRILMADHSRIMIHNAWGVAVGNRHDMAKAMAMLEPLDQDMASVYASRSGMDAAKVASLMDAETFMSVDDAIGKGFADARLAPAKVSRDKAKAPAKALAMVEASLTKAGYSRADRRELLKDLFSGKPRAAESATPCAGDTQTAALLQGLLNTIKA